MSIVLLNQLNVHIMLQGKQLIVVLNKIDLIPAPLAAAWKNYFISKERIITKHSIINEDHEKYSELKAYSTLDLDSQLTQVVQEQFSHEGNIGPEERKEKERGKKKGLHFHHWEKIGKQFFLCKNYTSLSNNQLQFLMYSTLAFTSCTSPPSPPTIWSEPRSTDAA